MRFLFDAFSMMGLKTLPQLIGNRRVQVRFRITFESGTLRDRLATVDPGRVIPYAGNPQPGFHEVCITYTDNKGQVKHQNVDICHLIPEPPRAKGQTLLLLRSPLSSSPEGPYGPYVAERVQRDVKKITVRDSITGAAVVYDFNQCIRILEDHESK